jgi:hypothetical protein
LTHGGVSDEGSRWASEPHILTTVLRVRGPVGARLTERKTDIWRTDPRHHLYPLTTVHVTVRNLDALSHLSVEELVARLQVLGEWRHRGSPCEGSRYRVRPCSRRSSLPMDDSS